MDSDIKIFKSTTFADLMSDVYNNSKNTSRQIKSLIGQLSPLIKNASDATIVVPLIKEYLDVSVRNDDHLVKLTAIVQRYISASSSAEDESELLPESERLELLRQLDEGFEDELTEVVDEIKESESAHDLSKINKVKERLAKLDGPQ